MPATLGFTTPRDDNDVPASYVAPLTSSANTKTVNVTSSSSVLLAANSNRKEAYVVNNSSTVMYVVPGLTAVSGAAAAANGGIAIPQYGGIVWDQTDNYTGPISAITGSGSAVAAVGEVKL